MDQGTGLILGQVVPFPGVTENFRVWRDYPLVVTSQLNGEVLTLVQLERDQWENGWKTKGRGWGAANCPVRCERRIEDEPVNLVARDLMKLVFQTRIFMLYVVSI